MFLENGTQKFKDMLDLVGKAKENRNPGRGPKSINNYLSSHDLTDEEIVARLSLIHPALHEYSDERKRELIKRSTKIGKLRRCPETRYRFVLTTAKQIVQASSVLGALKDERHPYNCLMADVNYDPDFCFAVYEFMQVIDPIMNFMEQQLGQYNSNYSK